MSQESPLRKSIFRNNREVSNPPVGTRSIPKLAEGDSSKDSSSSPRSAGSSDRLCPASFATFQKRSISLDQYRSAKTLEGLSHHSKNESSHKDHEFVWYDLDRSDSETETNTTVSKKKRGPADSVDFDLLKWTIRVHHYFGERKKDREFRQSIEKMEEEMLGEATDLNSSYLNSSFSSISSFACD